MTHMPGDTKLDAEELEAEEPEMRVHYSFKGGQWGRYAHLFPQEAGTVRHSVTDVLAEALGHLAFQTAEEVEAYLRGERDAWERQPNDVTSAA